MSFGLPILPANISTKGLSSCVKCMNGDYETSFRISVKNSVESRPFLFHVHLNETFVTILLRLCEEFPHEWRRDVIYYFYIDIGGIYHTIDEESWLRDKDTLIVTEVEDLNELPQYSLNASKVETLETNLYAFHADLRSDVELRPHQIEGIDKMIQLERQYRGGILADDMGLGKTVQTLTVVLKQQPILNTHACTLVVVPTRGIGDQWADEIRTKTTYGSLPYFIYHEESIALLSQPCFRVVITTYDRVRTEYKKKELGRVNESPLFDVDWYRIVLDESNRVRERTMLSSAVTELKGKYKWCLSGTPFQNDISELYPIFQFLNIDLNPKHKHDEQHMTEILNRHMIRRTKAILHHELAILPRQERRIVLEFSKPERALYDYIERLLYHQIMKARENGGVNNLMSSVAILYLRLKQVCGHHNILLEKFPDLIPLARSGEDNNVLNTFSSADDHDMTIEKSYYDEASEFEQALDLIEGYYDQFGNLQDPIDLSQLQKLKFVKHSTKIAWLVKFIQELLSVNHADKVVVVSQFVDTVNKVAEMLTHARIGYETYHGGMNIHSRRVALQKFNHDPHTKVIVMSLKAGGVGLNLQRANHMVIMDRWWNPATMDQAVARIHRMTQVKKTFIHTVVIKDTIEESLMDEILNKKNALFRKVVENNGFQGTRRENPINDDTPTFIEPTPIQVEDYEIEAAKQMSEEAFQYEINRLQIRIEAAQDAFC